MKRLLVFITALALLVSVDAGHATTIDVFSIRQSVDITGIGEHRGYGIKFLIDNPLSLVSRLQFNDVSRFEDGQGNQYLIDILQRTFRYEGSDREGDMPLAEAISMYEANFLMGLLVLTGTDNFTETMWSLGAIPDLSNYNINSLYAYDFTSVSGGVADLDIRIVADVTSAPEPSSFLLLALGAAGLYLANRARVRNG